MLRELVKNYKAVRAEQKGVAVSQARMIKNGRDIPEIAAQMKDGPAERIPGAFIRMKDGVPMQFATDGSLRHAFGKQVSKAAKKKAKKEQRAKAASARTSVVQS